MPCRAVTVTVGCFGRGAFETVTEVRTQGREAGDDQCHVLVEDGPNFCPSSVSNNVGLGRPALTNQGQRLEPAGSKMNGKKSRQTECNVDDPETKDCVYSHHCLFLHLKILEDEEG